MKDNVDRGYKYVQLYRNEHGGNMNEAARDLVADILIMLHNWGSDIDAEEASRLAWNNYVAETEQDNAS